MNSDGCAIWNSGTGWNDCWISDLEMGFLFLPIGICFVDLGFLFSFSTVDFWIWCFRILEWISRIFMELVFLPFWEGYSIWSKLIWSYCVLSCFGLCWFLGTRKWKKVLTKIVEVRRRSKVSQQQGYLWEDWEGVWPVMIFTRCCHPWERLRQWISWGPKVVALLTWTSFPRLQNLFPSSSAWYSYLLSPYFLVMSIQILAT